ncbi:magnesium transporter MRS2-I-like [Coffea eugenioides]|uniref:magnesium transporter MRS2-I-like n=1 Tax=Coffea eugenioides TaxID=49369 RepID=UPI000F60463A|nr:magnesium transporter MRS2-I-like [Coffea eugenioides]
MVGAGVRLRRRVSGVGRDDEVGRKKDAGSRSWKLMKSSGEEMDLDVDKYSIMRRVNVHARDLRILDPLLSYPSAILSRDRAIVLNLEHIKAIITAEEVLLRDQLDDNVIPVVEELRRRLKPINTAHEGQGDEDLPLQEGEEMGDEDESPFEFTALEVALEAICSYLAARGIELETAVYPAMEKLTSKVTSRKLDEVRKLKSQVARLSARVQKVREELKQLLNDDHDMANLYLSKKLPGASSPSPGNKSDTGSVSQGGDIHIVPTADGSDDDFGVEELEVILEAYFTHIDGTLNKLTMLRDHIDNTEDYIKLQLDKHRNRLMEVELFLSVTFICLSIYSTVAQLFGMSIPYSWNFGYGYLFKWVVIIPGLFSSFLFIFVISHACRRGIIGSYNS